MCKVKYFFAFSFPEEQRIRMTIRGFKLICMFYLLLIVIHKRDTVVPADKPSYSSQFYLIINVVS